MGKRDQNRALLTLCLPVSLLLAEEGQEEEEEEEEEVVPSVSGPSFPSPFATAFPPSL